MGSSRDFAPLRSGGHLTSHDGVCLMELVALTAGEPLSDRPSCTHPLMTHLARRVNDATSDRRRSELRVFVPALVAANTMDPSAFAGIAAACTRVALERKPSILLQTLHASAVRRSRPADMRRHWLYIHGAAYRSIDLAVFVVDELSEVMADRALQTMLRDALAVLERLKPPTVVDASEPLNRRGAASRRGRSAG